MILVAPTEPSKLKAIGESDVRAERWGVDILFPTAMGLAGIQRKEYTDLIASAKDGRLAKEVAQMQALPLKVLVVEGTPRWANGRLIHDYINWTYAQFQRLLFSVSASSVWVYQTRTLDETISFIHELQQWADKPDHTALRRFPEGRSQWLDNGKATASRILQSVDGVGPKLADAIVEKLGNPLKLTVTEAQLLTVPGLGKQRAKTIVRALGV